MRISKRGQITIPKRLRDQFGLNQDAEVEITPTARGLLIQNRPRRSTRWTVSAGSLMASAT